MQVILYCAFSIIKEEVQNPTLCYILLALYVHV